MKDKKFIIVTGTSMFLLLMMIIFNFGGPKSTYSASNDGCKVMGTNGCEECEDGYTLSGDSASFGGVCIPNDSSSSPALGYCYKCMTSSGQQVGQIYSDTVSAENGKACGPADNRGTWSETRGTKANCPNYIDPVGNSSSSSSSGGTTSVKPGIGVNVDSDNKVHVSLTTLWGCGGTLKVTGSGVSISGTTTKTVDNTTAVTSLVTGAYTRSSGATKGTITATYTITSTAAGYSCPPSVSKTITIFDDTPPADDTVTEAICTNGGGTWSNDACTCPSGKEWSKSYKECRCPIGQKDFSGVCKYAAGVTIVANKDVIVGTSHPLNINTTNGAICGGKVTLTSSLGNSISGFDVDSDTRKITYTPTKPASGSATDTINAKLEGIDTTKCYMNDSTASFELNLTNDKAKICKQYNGTWNEPTKTCNCNNGYYWSDEVSKCLAYSPEDDPTRIAPILELSWTEKKIKKGSSEKLTVCAKAPNGAGVGGRYYVAGYNHSNGSIQQEAVPAGGCFTVTIHGITVGTDTLKVQFSPDDLDHYKPVSANAEVCVYDDDESVCGSGNGDGPGGGDEPGGSDGPGGNWTDPGTNPGGNGNTTTNPQTGNIMLFVVWIIGFGCVGYSFWYFKNVNKNGA